MAGDHVATSSVVINAPAGRVWEVLTDPAAVKEFMFGADVVTDWTVGAPIVWRGQWEGKDYEDKGVIQEVEPGRRLVHTHFSPLSGDADEPGNYHTLTWTLEGQSGEDQRDTTRLTLSQDNNASEEAAAHSKGMWDKLVADVKAIAERP